MKVKVGDTVKLIAGKDKGKTGKVIKTLKNREYATRGIPFIYSEQDSDFDQQPYVLKAPADESPINVRDIIDFIDHFVLKPEEIRKTVQYLTWKIQMQQVLNEVF